MNRCFSMVVLLLMVGVTPALAADSTPEERKEFLAAGVAKLDLRVAIVKRSAQKPIQAKETQIVASANRTLSYTT